MRYWILTVLLLTACQGAASNDNVQQAMQQATNRSAAAVADPSPSASAPSASASVAANTLSTGTIKVGGQSIPVEVADTFQTRAKGLSGRPSLAKNTGLVLAWGQPEITKIWMPDMNFAIDVIFVRDKKIVYIEKSAQPCPSRADCPTFGPDTPVNYVLEVPAGSATEWGIKAGDAIELVR